LPAFAIVVFAGPSSNCRRVYSRPSAVYAHFSNEISSFFNFSNC